MAEEQNTANQQATPQVEEPSDDAGRATRLLQWAGDSKLRMSLVGGLFIGIFGGIFATWSYLAHLAVRERDEFTLARALEALDNNEFDRAKIIVGEMQNQGVDPEEFGGALYVLGAVKAFQAEQEWSRARQRAMHLVAARYLQKARELGVPSRLHNRAQFLVGRSLIRGNQPQDGIAILLSALDAEDLPKTELHALLAEAYLSIPEPDLTAALNHNQAVLGTPELDEQQRTEASIIQAEILSKLGKLEEAKQFLDIAGTTKEQEALLKLLKGELLISQTEKLAFDDPQRAVLADQAQIELSEAQRLDPLNSDLVRKSAYWIGKSYEVSGDTNGAIQRYDQLGKSYGDTPESMTAQLAKADLILDAGDTAGALAGYRAVLNSMVDPTVYVNPLLSLNELRKRLLRAYNVFVDGKRFEEAMALVDALQPTFSLEETTELRAQAHQKWAESIVIVGEDVSHREVNEYLAKGRYHYRAAGVAYELLSKLRFSSRQFTDDLWNAAECFFQGQSYSHAERLLEEYLHHQAQHRQALALLRLGQSQLAQGNSAEAVETLLQCVEMYPHDAVIYQARIEGAHALLQQGEGDRARQLLNENLFGGSLKPEAQEWRDSVFLLGDYLHNSDQYADSIYYLDEAVSRYPNDPKSLIARYTIARSYHRAAEIPAKLAREAKTESERQKNRKLRDENMEAALENYLQVQRLLTLQGHVDSNDLERLLLRNCYMMQGSVLFELKQYEEARKAYANVSTLYQNEPFVLESFVHIANCYRKLNKPIKAKGTIEQAKLVLNRLPADTDFKIATNFSRQSWELLLNEMSVW